MSPFSKILHSVGDVPRLSIVYALAHQPMDVREIIDITGIPSSLMSHHLKKLFQAGWVSKRKYGKRIEYTLLMKNFNVFHQLLKDTPAERERSGGK